MSKGSKQIFSVLAILGSSWWAWKHPGTEGVFAQSVAAIMALFTHPPSVDSLDG